MTRTRAQLAGDATEAWVAASLEGDGWTILARQLRVGRAEIDLLALDPGPPRRLVAVEVRWRSVRAWGLPEETVDRRKLTRLRLALARVVAAGALPDGTPIPPAVEGVDLVAVEPPATAEARPRTRHHRNVG